MKKIKIILCFIVMIFGLNYLSSCISEKTPPEEFKPEVSFLLQSIDSSSINFNIQVTEPKSVTIEEIYISLYNGSNKEVELTSNDGIHKVGLTEEITFDSLESSHSYKMDFSFDYFLGEEKKENIVIYSYDFVTATKTMGVSGTISNWKLDTSLVTFDATIQDEDNIVTDFKICLYSGAELVAKLDTTDGLKIGTNLACTFDTLLPMKEYSVILFATFTFDGQQYMDYKLDGKSFKTIDFSYLPTVEISNLLLAKDIVTFDLTVLDEFKVLTSLSINILDSNDTFLVDLVLKGGIESGEHTIEFNLLEPKKEYKIKVLANYSYGQVVVTQKCLAEKSFRTEDYPFYPTAEISNVKVNNDTVTFTCTILDEKKLLTGLSIGIKNDADVIITEKELKVGSSVYECSFNKLEPNTHYALAVFGKYNCPTEVNRSLDSYGFWTNEYSFYPTIDITHVDFEEDVLFIDYYLNDSVSLLTDLKCIILTMEDEIVKSMFLNDKMTNGFHSISLENIKLNEFKIRMLANYSYLNIEKENEIIGNLEYKANSKSDFEYAITNVGVVINKYVGESNICIIPNEIDGKEVTIIANRAFYNSTIKNVILPDSVTHIDEFAFYGCKNLTSITLPNGITSIESSTFAVCSKLIHITLPASLTSIGEHAFDDCNSLVSISIPENVTSIGDYAFYNCGSLTSLVIPNHVTSIGASAFEECVNLKSITLSSDLRSIGEDAFFYCTNLTEVYYEGNIEDWCKISFVDNDSNPMCKASHFYIRNSDNAWEEVTTIEISEAITEIGAYQFYSFNNVTSIQLPDTITSIGDSAFYKCNNLKSIVIPNGVSSIGASAFSGCVSLTSIHIPSILTRIEAMTFSECSNLKNIVIPNQVTYIGVKAFSGCSSLTSIIIPNSVTTMQENVFDKCYGIVIHCEATSKPDYWVSTWVNESQYLITVTWGYTTEE